MSTGSSNRYYCNLRIAYKSSNSLSQLLGNPTMKIPLLVKSGMYEIKCDLCDKIYFDHLYDMIYIGQKVKLSQDLRKIWPILNIIHLKL